MKNSLVFPLTALMALSLTGCATIDPGERGIKVELGVMKKDLLAPGLFGYNPFTERIHTFTTKQISVEGSANPLTSDQQPLAISFRVQYRLPEGQLLNLFQNVQGDPYQALGAPQVQESFRQVVSQYKAEAVTGGVNAIKAQVLAMTRESVKGQIEIIDIPITHIELPEALQKAVIEKQEMEISAKKKQYELDREKKQAEITVAKAQAEAESIRLQSQALANSPKLVELKWVEKWDGKLPETVAGNSSIIMGLKK